MILFNHFLPTKFNTLNNFNILVHNLNIDIHNRYRNGYVTTISKITEKHKQNKNF